MFDDGVVPVWYHSRCFFAIQKNIHTSQIENFENLKYERQLEIILKIGSDRIESYRKFRKRKISNEIISCNCYAIEYSNFVQTCIQCKDKIKKGSLRIRMLKDYRKALPDWENEKLFVHFKCFHENRFEFKYIWGGERLQGFDSLHHEDQEMIKDCLP